MIRDTGKEPDSEEKEFDKYRPFKDNAFGENNLQL